jgi:hypothetical protein
MRHNRKKIVLIRKSSWPRVNKQKQGFTPVLGLVE